MNKQEIMENRKNWMVALRSGRYKQGRVFLKSRGKYCCLGVLCDLYNPENWVGDEYKYNDQVFSSFPGYDILQNVGISMDDATALYDMNDNRHYDFNEIADAIEKMPINVGKG